MDITAAGAVARQSYCADLAAEWACGQPECLWARTHNSPCLAFGAAPDYRRGVDL